MKDREAREIAADVLRAKGYAVRDVSSGQGRPKLSQLELTRGSERLLCAVKVAQKSMNGRIHFPRTKDEHGNYTGGYDVLSEVDLVLHVRTRPTGVVNLTLFDQATILASFNKGLKALEAEGMQHLPIWVSPEPEAGWRQVGSGFGDKALWSEIIGTGTTPPLPLPSAPAMPSPVVPSEAVHPLSIAEAKLAVAAKYEVTPDKVEIIVRG